MRASKRKAAILASAAPIFNQRGFAGTSIADILEATALEKGGLYNHFASKEQLAVEAFDYAYGEVEAYFTRSLGGTRSGLERLRTYIGAFERYIERPVVDGGCPVVNACIEADDALPFLRERVAKAFRAMRSVVAHNVARAAERGELPADLDVEEATDFIVASLEGSAVLTRGLRSRVHARRVATALRRWLDALALSPALQRTK
jgi:TetR/AcrR family transcriptional regulator, transcriptional repressor for nem operon